MRRRRWDLLAAPPIAAATVGLSVGIAMGTNGPSLPPAPPLAQVVPRVQLATERPTREVDIRTARPIRIEIASIGVSARIVPLGLAPDRSMETPARFTDAGWYDLGPRPGEAGPAVIAGHVDSKTGPAVFYRLGDLRRGAIVRVVRADGSAVRFRVEGLERWPKASFPTRRVFGQTRASTLRIVTCSGAFDRSTGHYLDNTVVYAVRISAPLHQAAIDRRHEAGVVRGLVRRLPPALLPLDRLEQHRARALHLRVVAP
jgi:hypothetical protein